MGTFNSNILPTTTGLSLGSQAQKWLLNGLPSATLTTITVPSSTTPNFTSSNVITLFTMTLTNNVTSSTLNLASVALGFIIFQFTIGSNTPLTFTWPINVNGGVTIGNGPFGQTTSQLFLFDGTNAWALTEGTTWP